MRRNPRGGRGNYDSGRDRGRGRGGGGRKRDELDPMDPSSYSDVPRCVIRSNQWFNKPAYANLVFIALSSDANLVFIALSSDANLVFIALSSDANLVFVQ